MRREKQEKKSEAAGPRLLAEERRREILRRVNAAGRVTVSEVAERFGVTVVTARGDLDALARGGRVTRSHGGAVRAGESVEDVPLDVKGRQHREEKLRIAAAAAAMVEDGEKVLLDSGTTTVAVARALVRRGLRLTVVTHALNVAAELSHSPQISLMMVGGMLRRISQSFVGPQAHEMLAGLHVDHFFLAVDGLDVEVGLCTPDVFEAEINGAMIRTARETTVVADSSKLGRRSLSVIAPLTAVKRLITDSGITAVQKAELEAKGLTVIVV